MSRAAYVASVNGGIPFDGWNFNIINLGGPASLTKMHLTRNGDVYFVEEGPTSGAPYGRILKRTYGSNDIIVQSSILGKWTNITEDSVGDIFAVYRWRSNQDNGLAGVYKQVGGVGTFTQIFQFGNSSSTLYNIEADLVGNVYAACRYSGGYIYRKPPLSDNFSSIGYGGEWESSTVDSLGNIYFGDFGSYMPLNQGILKISNGYSGNSYLTLPSLAPMAMCCDLNNNLYLGILYASYIVRYLYGETTYNSYCPSGSVYRKGICIDSSNTLYLSAITGYKIQYSILNSGIVNYYSPDIGSLDIWDMIIDKDNKLLAVGYNSLYVYP